MTPQRPLSGCELGKHRKFLVCVPSGDMKDEKSPGMPYHGLILLHVCRGNSHGCVCRRAQGHTEGQGGSGGNPRGALTLKLPRVSRAKGNKTQVLGKKHHHKLLCWNVSKIPQNGVQRMSIHNNNSLITSENKSYTCFGQNKL